MTPMKSQTHSAESTQRTPVRLGLQPERPIDYDEQIVDGRG